MLWKVAVCSSHFFECGDTYVCMFCTYGSHRKTGSFCLDLPLLSYCVLPPASRTLFRPATWLCLCLVKQRSGKGRKSAAGNILNLGGVQIWGTEVKMQSGKAECYLFEALWLGSFNLEWCCCSLKWHWSEVGMLWCLCTCPVSTLWSWTYQNYFLHKSFFCIFSHS